MIALLLLALFLFAPAAFAETPDSTHAYHHQDAPVIQAAPLRDHIRVDGKLDEAAWKDATPVTQFTQDDPEEGKPVSERTEVRFLIGDDALYVGARLYDREPSKIRRRLVRRDENLASDYVAILIDSYHDHLTAFRFRVNPAGSFDDATIDARGNHDFSWDPVWQVRTTIDAEGWTAEMEIPLSQLRFNPSNDVWGIQIRRWIDRKQELAEFSFTPKKENADVSRYGHLTGLGGLSARRGVELMPYGLAKAQNTFAPAGDPFRDGSEQSGSVGADLKWALKGDMTLNATVHPDFGQVEVDPAVVNLTATETFFPEKRPFFVERSELFNFGQTQSSNYFSVPTTFHARRIGRVPQRFLSPFDYAYLDMPAQTTIAAAAKLTGKTRSGWSIGALDAVTTEERARFLDTLGEEQKLPVEPLTNYGVARVRRELGGGNTRIGGIVTDVSRDLSEGLESLLRRHATVGGVDFAHYWAGRRWSVDGYFQASRVSGSADAIAATQRSSAHYFQRPDADHLTYDPTRTSLEGISDLISLNKLGGKHWKASFTYQDLSPGFESNDVGYISNVDTWGVSSLGMYKEDKPTKLLRNWYAMAFSNNAWNHGGDLQYQGYEAQWSGTFSNYWYGDLRGSWYPKAYDDRLTRGGPLAVIPPGGRIAATINSDARKGVLYGVHTDWSWNDAGANAQRYSPFLTLHPRPSLLVRLEPNIQKIRDMAQYVTTVSDPTATETFGNRYVFATLDEHVVSLDTRVDWTFTPRLSLQLYLQPYIVSGLYRELKQLHARKTYDFDVFGSETGTIAPDSTGSGYVIDPDGGGPAAAFALGKPDFNFRSLLGNAVLRWEYRPGSVLFLVWQQNRGGVQSFGDYDFSRDFRAIFNERPENIIAVKATYWLGI